MPTTKIHALANVIGQRVETHIRAEVMTAGRNNEALEQVGVRLSIEDEVSNLSWSIVQSSME
jgi:putative Mg2+ transporter-C (MgtC) family protein